MAPELLGLPAMTEVEVSRLTHYLKACRIYLEYGCGGSTLLALNTGVPRLFAVDSDADWIHAVRSHPDIAIRVASGDYEIFHADIGETAHWGYPRDKSKQHDFDQYYSAIWNRMPEAPDLILIDGRFRVACALETIANVSSKAIIAIHDFDR